MVSPFDFAVPSGVNQHVKHLSRELRYRGHDVTVIAPLSDQNRAPAIPNFYSVGGVVPVPANGSIAYISFSLSLWHRIRQLLEGKRFDIVHCHEPLTPLLNLAFLRQSNATNIGTFHAYGAKSPHYTLFRPVLRPFFNRLDGRVAVSELAREFAFRYFGGDYRIIPNGVDMCVPQQHAIPLEHLMDGRPNILFLGRFEETRKGFRVAIEALAAVRQTFADVRLVVVGRGDQSRYREIIHRLGVERNIHFAGSVSDEDRARYMASCQLLIAPNTGGESQGLVVLEAMAAGLPVIASDIRAFANVIRNGKEGVLFQPEHSQALARAVVHMLSDPSASRQMAIHGKVKAAEFHWPKVATELVEYYAEVCERKAWNEKQGQSGSHVPSIQHSRTGDA